MYNEFKVFVYRPIMEKNRLLKSEQVAIQIFIKLTTFIVY